MNTARKAWKQKPEPVSRALLGGQRDRQDTKAKVDDRMYRRPPEPYFCPKAD